MTCRAKPKTDYRTVPTPPPLIELLRSWIEEHAPRAGRSAVPDSERSACAIQLVPIAAPGLPEGRTSTAAGVRPAACGAHDLAAGWGPAGRGRSAPGAQLETLMSTYVGALQGDDVAANKLIDAASSTTREQIDVNPWSSSRALLVATIKTRGNRRTRGQSRARR
jgi:hypothetical protein